MKDILQVVALHTFLRVEELKELLNKLRGHKDLELPDLNRLVDNKLQEEFIDTLKVGPRGVHLLILVDTRLRKCKVRFLDVRKRAENVLLDHRHHLLNVRDDKLGHILLIGEHLLELLDCV